MAGYPDLHGQFDWTQGIHKAPTGYQHPWLIVTDSGTVGAWSRQEARTIWKRYRESGSLEYAESR